MNNGKILVSNYFIISYKLYIFKLSNSQIFFQETLEERMRETKIYDNINIINIWYMICLWIINLQKKE